jgi:colicin import membrane protein
MAQAAAIQEQDKTLVAVPSPQLEVYRPTITDADKALEAAQAYVIDSPQMFEIANEELTEIANRIKAVEAVRDELADPYKRIKAEAENGRKKVFDFFQPAIAKLTQAKTVLTRALTQYTQELERKRQEAEAAAREEARRQQEALEKQAQKAEKKGDVAKAQELRAQAPLAAAPVQAPEVPKLKGGHTRTVWKGRLLGATDAERKAAKIKLIQFVAKNPQWEHLLEVDESALNKVAGSLRENLGTTIEGVEGYPDTGFVRGR